MNNENENLISGPDDSILSNQESSGLNDTASHGNARDYENKEPIVEKNEKTGQVRANEVDDDINALEHGHQNHPGSSGAFPVGAFDTSKD